MGSEVFPPISPRPVRELMLERTAPHALGGGSVDAEGVVDDAAEDADHWKEGEGDGRE